MRVMLNKRNASCLCIKSDFLFFLTAEYVTVNVLLMQLAVATVMRAVNEMRSAVFTFRNCNLESDIYCYFCTLHHRIYYSVITMSSSWDDLKI